MRAFWESMERRVGPTWRIMLLVALDEWHDRRGVFPVAFSNPSRRNICFEIEQDNVMEQSRLRVRVR